MLFSCKLFAFDADIVNAGINSHVCISNIISLAYGPSDWQSLLKLRLVSKNFDEHSTHFLKSREIVVKDCDDFKKCLKYDFIKFINAKNINFSEEELNELIEYDYALNHLKGFRISEDNNKVESLESLEVLFNFIKMLQGEDMPLTYLEIQLCSDVEEKDFNYIDTVCCSLEAFSKNALLENLDAYAVSNIEKPTTLTPYKYYYQKYFGENPNHIGLYKEHLVLTESDDFDNSSLEYFLDAFQNTPPCLWSKKVKTLHYFGLSKQFLNKALSFNFFSPTTLKITTRNVTGYQTESIEIFSSIKENPCLKQITQLDIYAVSTFNKKDLINLEYLASDLINSLENLQEVKISYNNKDTHYCNDNENIETKEEADALVEPKTFIVKKDEDSLKHPQRKKRKY
ncbi:MAG TPA: hypothetical protein VI959_05455 [Alphaproteobacteria bacterium]|nr:hypothetical protein [Alphaproteobacteria bacterium]